MKNITYNLKEENPLVTILKNGLIPVVSVCYHLDDKTFENASLFNYLEKLNNNCIDLNGKKNFGVDLDNLPNMGVLSFIGGIRFSSTYEDYFCGFKVGALDPDAYVTNTYILGNSKYSPLSKITAKEKYLECLNYYNYAKKFINEEDPDSKTSFIASNVDFFSEVIVDARMIGNVLYIPGSDFHLIWDTSFDSFLRFSNFDSLFSAAFELKGIPFDLLSSFGVDLVNYNNDEVRYTYANEVCSKINKKITAKAVEEFINDGTIITSFGEYKKDFEAFKKDRAYGKIEECIIYGENWVSMTLKPPGVSIGQVHLKVDNDKFYISCDITDVYNRKVYDKKMETFEDILRSFRRKEIYESISAYVACVKMVRKYIPTFQVNKDLEMFYNLYSLEKSILKASFVGENFGISEISYIDDYTMKMQIGVISSIRYNYVLDDFIVRLYNKFYYLKDFLDDDEYLKDDEDFQTYNLYYNFKENLAILRDLFLNSSFYKDDYRKTFLEKLVNEYKLSK